MSNSSGQDETATGHLHEIEDGVGCTEIWERMNDIRADESPATSTDD